MTDKMDKPKEACGIFGIYAPGEDVARLTYFGLLSLQHRGQESAGIAVSSGQDVAVYKDMGLVPQVFNERILGILKGISAIGHTRYSTTGSSVLCNAQPILIRQGEQAMALGHNGNLVNTLKLKRALETEGVSFESTTDSEVMAYTILHQPQSELGEKLISACKKFRGAYCVVLLTAKELVAIRDPYGIRPLCLGKFDSSYVVASESCALHVIGAQYIRDVEPGEILIINKEGLTSLRIPVESNNKKALCVFEFIYFARPDSHMDSRSVHFARKRMGQLLAREHPVGADLVIPVPDSSTAAAIGFAEESKIPFGEGIIKNRYIHRTFIQPDQRLRDLGVRMKLNLLKEEIYGKRVCIVDDSIVRGTTSKKIVQLFREAGAREVHIRVASPPIKSPCYYGIDFATTEELIAASRTVDEIRDKLGADSLAYLSIENLVRSIDLPEQHFCMACLTEEYPIKIPKQQQLELGKFALEKGAERIMKR